MTAGSGSGGRRRPPWAVPAALALGLALVLLLGFAYASVRLGDVNEAQVRSRVTNQLAPYASSLTATVNARLAMLVGLHEYVTTLLPQGPNQHDFDTFAAGLSARASGIRSVQVAPNGVIRFVYPADDIVAGHDLFSDTRPEVLADIQRTLRSDHIVISGPYELRQGGLGMVGREAVLTSDGKFWGFVIMVLDIPPILESSGLAQSPEGLRFAVRDSKGRVFAGDESVFDESPVAFSNTLPDGEWEIAAVPAEGWAAASSQGQVALWAAAIVITLALGLLLFLALTQRQSMRAGIAEQTAHLRAQRDLFERVTETSPVGITVVAGDGMITTANAEAERILGLDRDDISQRTYDDPLWHVVGPSGEPFPAEQLPVARVLASGAPVFNVRFCIEWPDGQRRVLSVNAAPLRDAAGEMAGAVAAFLDITELEEAEQALHHQELLLGEMGRVARIGGWEFNPATGEGTWTAETARIHDVDPADETGMARGLSFFHGEHRTKIERAIEEAVEHGRDYDLELEMVSAKGVRRWVQTIGHPVVENGEVVRVRGSLQDITERKSAEVALRQSEARLSSLFEQANDGIFVITADNRYLDANPSGLEMMGYTLEELRGMSVAAVLVPDERRRLEVEPPRMMSGVPHLAEWMHQRKDGSTFPGEVSARRLDDESYLAIVRDLTQRRQAELAVRESEERLRLALDAAHMGTFDWDIPGDHIVWSRWHEEMWGFAPGEFAGTYEAFASRLHPDDLPLVDAEVARCIAECDGFMREFRVVWPDASVHWVISRGEFTWDDHGQPLRMNGVVVETTARKQAEEELRKREADLAKAQEIAHLGSYTYDLSDRTGSWSEEMYRIYGVSPQTFTPNAEAFMSLVHVDDRPAMHAWVEEVAAGGRPGELEFRAVPPDGTVRVISVRGELVRDAGGGPPFMAGIAQDITERKRAEEEIRRLNEGLERRVEERTAELAAARDRAEEADRIKSAFLATMSHELRTPLNSVIGFTGILLQDLAGPLNDEQRKQLGMVQGSARHLLTLINDVLDLSKIEAGELKVRREPFAIGPVVERAMGAIGPLAQKKGLALRLESPAELGALVSDERRVEQVLLNLLGNAVKFTEQGEVVLTIDGVEAPRPAVRFVVRDTGIGMASDDLATLFEPFRQLDTGLTRQHEGTGLGLAICRRLADLLGGEIRAESEYGVGSAFTFAVPRAGTEDQA